MEDWTVILCKLLILIQMRFVLFSCWDETEPERNGFFNEYLLALSFDASIFLAYYKMKWHIYIYIVSVYAWQFPSLDQWKPNPLKSLLMLKTTFDVWMILSKVTHIKLPIVIWPWKWILKINNMLWQLSAICSQTEIFCFSMEHTHTHTHNDRVLAGNAPCKVNLI